MWGEGHDRIPSLNHRVIKVRETTEQTEATEITEFDFGIEDRVPSEQRYFTGLSHSASCLEND
jgi:hypothetical protein